MVDRMQLGGGGVPECNCSCSVGSDDQRDFVSASHSSHASPPAPTSTFRQPHELSPWRPKAANPRKGCRREASSRQFRASLRPNRRKRQKHLRSPPHLPYLPSQLSQRPTLTTRTLCQCDSPLLLGSARSIRKARRRRPAVHHHPNACG
jgi:hypothetical protein